MDLKNFVREEKPTGGFFWSLETQYEKVSIETNSNFWQEKMMAERTIEVVERRGVVKSYTYSGWNKYSVSVHIEDRDREADLAFDALGLVSWDLSKAEDITQFINILGTYHGSKFKPRNEKEYNMTQILLHLENVCMEINGEDKAYGKFCDKYFPGGFYHNVLISGGGIVRASTDENGIFVECVKMTQTAREKWQSYLAFKGFRVKAK